MQFVSKPSPLTDCLTQNCLPHSNIKADYCTAELPKLQRDLSSQLWPIFRESHHGNRDVSFGLSSGERGTFHRVRKDKTKQNKTKKEKKLTLELMCYYWSVYWETQHLLRLGFYTDHSTSTHLRGNFSPRFLSVVILSETLQ